MALVTVVVVVVVLRWVQLERERKEKGERHYVRVKVNNRERCLRSDDYGNYRRNKRPAPHVGFSIPTSVVFRTPPLLFSHSLLHSFNF